MSLEDKWSSLRSFLSENHSQVIKLFRYIFSFLLIFVGLIVNAADILVSVDRDPVSIDDSFQLTFHANGELDNAPDFSPLEKDFEILAQQKSTNVSINNGDYRRTSTWTLNVMAKKSGELIIPAISFGNDSSQASSLNVKAPVINPQKSYATPATLMLETEVTPENPYVQSQIILTVRVLHRINIAQARLNEPEIENVVIEKLGEGVSYNTNRDGYQYGVLERKYAVFPQKSGILMIEPFELNAQVITSRQSNSMFDSFFSRNPTTTKRVRSKPLALKVKAIPKEFSGKIWLPAKRFSLTESWPRQPPKSVAGEPITRTLRIEAEGLSASQLPELSDYFSGITTNNDSDLKQYPDQPTLKDQKTAAGITSVREEKTALILSKAGTFTLPEITIPWWNTETDHMEFAKIDKQAVTASPSSLPNQPQSQATPDVNTPGSTTQSAGSEIKARTQEQWLWKIFSLVLALGWITTVVTWWLQNRKSQQLVSQESTRTINERKSIKELRKACRHNDAQSAKTALLDWAKAIWPEQPPAGLGAIGIRSGGSLNDEIKWLNQYLYGKQTGDWSGQALWNAFSEYRKELGINRSADVFELEPLYKT